MQRTSGGTWTWKYRGPKAVPLEKNTSGRLIEASIVVTHRISTAFRRSVEDNVTSDLDLLWWKRCGWKTVILMTVHNPLARQLFPSFLSGLGSLSRTHYFWSATEIKTCVWKNRAKLMFVSAGRCRAPGHDRPPPTFLRLLVTWTARVCTWGLFETRTHGSIFSCFLKSFMSWLNLWAIWWRRETKGRSHSTILHRITTTKSKAGELTCSDGLLSFSDKPEKVSREAPLVLRPMRMARSSSLGGGGIQVMSNFLSGTMCVTNDFTNYFYQQNGLLSGSYFTIRREHNTTSVSLHGSIIPASTIVQKQYYKCSLSQFPLFIIGLLAHK